MYNIRKLTDDLTWIGGIDRKIQKFENVYKLNSGMTIHISLTAALPFYLTR